LDFVFHHSKVVDILHFAFYGELNTPFPFHLKILCFGPSFCIIELNTIQNFWQKYGYSPFWILASRGKKKAKRASRGHNKGNKFCILSETKHNPEYFGILHLSFQNS